MEKVMDDAVKKFNMLGMVMGASMLVFFALVVWAAFQWSWGWGEHMAPDRRVHLRSIVGAAHRHVARREAEEGARPDNVPRGLGL